MITNVQQNHNLKSKEQKKEKIRELKKIAQNTMLDPYERREALKQMQAIAGGDSSLLPSDIDSLNQNIQQAFDQAQLKNRVELSPELAEFFSQEAIEQWKKQKEDMQELCTRSDKILEKYYTPKETELKLDKLQQTLSNDDYKVTKEDLQILHSVPTISQSDMDLMNKNLSEHSKNIELLYTKIERLEKIRKSIKDEDPESRFIKEHIDPLLKEYKENKSKQETKKSKIEECQKLQKKKIDIQNKINKQSVFKDNAGIQILEKGNIEVSSGSTLHPTPTPTPQKNKGNAIKR